MIEPNLAPTHPHYPDGFPARPNDDLLGHWETPKGVVVVEDHPHGYEIHFYPCYDFAGCDACAPDRGPSNPHTDDGHHFRLCEKHGMILTVAGDKARTVLEYLATEESPPHIAELARLRAEEEETVADQRRRDQEEHDAAIAEAALNAPSPAERMAALEAELEVLRAMFREQD